MPKITIDGREVEVDAGATILDAAGKLGIAIPTMCHLRGYEPTTSCMVCVVKVAGAGGLVPACGALAQEGMQVESDCEAVFEARKAALELLLSDHVGDCVGPCQMGCPARMNIPLMIRQIAAGQMEEAIATVKRDIALPAVLGRICPAPCEKVCRRKQHDEAVSILRLKRHVADVDLESDGPYSPPMSPKRDKRVAIIGAGPAGLAAAYYLQQDGFDCTVFDQRQEPGGMLRYAVMERSLPRDVLNMEIAQIEKLGVTFRLRTRFGIDILMNELREQFDAVFLGLGELKPDDADVLGVEVSPDGVKVDRRTGATSLPGVFAGGDVVRKRRLTVRAVADGKEAAVSIRQYLTNGIMEYRNTGTPADPVSHSCPPHSIIPSFQHSVSSRMGKLAEGEMDIFLRSASGKPRTNPFRPLDGYTPDEARAEAVRCLHCDCRKPDDCLLRRYAKAYDARQGRYKAERAAFVQQTKHPDVIYEPGKCIDCGICIRIASARGEKLGLTFVGRGFDVRVAVPFGESLAEGLQIAAAECVKACPTGALAFKDSL